MNSNTKKEAFSGDKDSDRREILPTGPLSKPKKLVLVNQLEVNISDDRTSKS